jgi:F-type H+-transporting ATPase subunit b
VLTAVVNVIGSSVEVSFLEGKLVAAEEAPPANDLNPIAPEPKEMLWGFGAFLVFLVVLRLFLFPPLKRSMEARYARVRGDHEDADATKAAARSDVADYESRLAEVRAEAAARVDAARATLESERQARLAQVNERVAERKAAAQAEIDAAREAARSQVEAAVADVASMAGELATGRRPDPGVVSAAVTEVLSAGVAR